MPIYECTLYERPKFGDRCPVVIDGRTVSDEVVAESHGKARYRYFLRLSDAWGDEVKIQDIRVKSLANRQAPPMAHGWEERLNLANAIIRVIAKYGRHFFSSNADKRELVPDPFIAHFQVDRAGELWFIDSYTRKPVLVRHRDWSEFSGGGTLRSIVEHLAEHIKLANPIRNGYFSSSPTWVCGGDLWGYGEDMPKVAAEVRKMLFSCGETV